MLQCGLWGPIMLWQWCLPCPLTCLTYACCLQWAHQDSGLGLAAAWRRLIAVAAHHVEGGRPGHWAWTGGVRGAAAVWGPATSAATARWAASRGELAACHLAGYAVKDSRWPAATFRAIDKMLGTAGLQNEQATPLGRGYTWWTCISRLLLARLASSAAQGDSQLIVTPATGSKVAIGEMRNPIWTFSPPSGKDTSLQRFAFQVWEPGKRVPRKACWRQLPMVPPM